MAIPAIAAGAAVLSAGYGVVAGEQASADRKKSLRKQARAQDDAQAKAPADTASAERQNAIAGRKRSDIGQLLTDSQLLAAQGIGGIGTRNSVDPQRLKLSRASLLGG